MGRKRRGLNLRSMSPKYWAEKLIHRAGLRMLGHRDAATRVVVREQEDIR